VQFSATRVHPARPISTTINASPPWIFTTFRQPSPLDASDRIDVDQGAVVHQDNCQTHQLPLIKGFEGLITVQLRGSRRNSRYTFTTKSLFSCEWTALFSWLHGNLPAGSTHSTIVLTSTCLLSRSACFVFHSISFSNALLDISICGRLNHMILIALSKSFPL
jgi:hypothetical protein